MNNPGMNSLDAQILTSEHALFDGEVTGVRMPGGDGSFEVRPMHAPIISTLKPGLIIARTTAGEELRFAVSGGVAEFYNNSLSLLAEAAERVEEIDVERAERAQQRAEARLKKASYDQSIDQPRAEKARIRAKKQTSTPRKIRLTNPITFVPLVDYLRDLILWPSGLMQQAKRRKIQVLFTTTLFKNETTPNFNNLTQSAIRL